MAMPWRKSAPPKWCRCSINKWRNPATWRCWSETVKRPRKYAKPWPVAGCAAFICQTAKVFTPRARRSIWLAFWRPSYRPEMPSCCALHSPREPCALACQKLSKSSNRKRVGTSGWNASMHGTAHGSAKVSCPCFTKCCTSKTLAVACKKRATLPKGA